ncbi:MAG: peptide deformylase [Candidatus Peribacteria bacterium]|nr:MAG: peptide deformylase [Candidatus Peribacteria bacterium]
MVAITERDTRGKKMLTPEPVILLNPVIIDHSDETLIGEEGCLSLPNLYGDVERFRAVTVQYTTPQGKHKVQKRT